MASLLKVDTLQSTTQGVSVDIGDIPKMLYRGQYHLLRGTSSGTDYNCNYTAETLVLADSSYNCKVFRNISVTINAANLGINGIDVGSVTAGYWYYSYVIYNPSTSTISGIVSLSSTAPTLPSGYTYYARVGSLRVLSGNTFFSKISQFNSRINYINTSTISYGENVIFTNISYAAYTQVSLSTMIPATCPNMYFYFDSVTSTNVWLTATGLAYDYNEVVATTYNVNTERKLVISTAQQTYIKTSGSSVYKVVVIGYEDTL